MKFSELKLNTRLLQGIADRGYSQTTDVQARTLAETLRGKDVAVQSQTGTGKTAAFLITIFERALNGGGNGRKKALIIVPTRELAIQIEKEALLLNRPLGFAIGSFYGGVGYAGQLASLKNGLDVFIGTPGRLLDLQERGCLKLKDIEILVIDEADRLFDMGFLPDIKKLLGKLPRRNARQSMLFSATMNRISRSIAFEHMNHPAFIEVTPEQLTVDTILQELYYVKSHIKLNLMLGLLKAQAPQNALIFTNMKHTAFRLARKLQLNGYQSRHLTGDLTQSQRMQVMKDFKAGRFPFLVATDVAARGLHIEGLEMVINYDLPQDYESYVHRIGRTARAGNSGKAISLASEGTTSHLEAIESYIGMKIPVLKADFSLFATDLSLEYGSGSKPGNGRGARGGRPHSRSRSAERGRRQGRRRPGAF